MAGKPSMAGVQHEPGNPIPLLDYQAIFEAYPYPGVVLSAEAHFPILAANDRYLETTGTGRKELLGRGFFEVFPENPDASGPSGIGGLQASFARVVLEKEPEVMGIQKYDARSRKGRNRFHLKYGIPVNVPVMEPHGAVAYIIHKVLDVTHFMAPGEPPPAPARPMAASSEALIAAITLPSTILSHLSHQASMPVKAILGLTQALLESGPSPRQLDLTKKAQASAAGLLDDLHAAQGWLRERVQPLFEPQAPDPAMNAGPQDLVPICAWCQRVRNEQSSWEGLAGYVSRRLGVAWTHGICPECWIQVFRETIPQP